MKTGITLVAISWAFLFTMALLAPYRPAWLGGTSGLEDDPLPQSVNVDIEQDVLPDTDIRESTQVLVRRVSTGPTVTASRPAAVPPAERDPHLQLPQTRPSGQNCRRVSTEAVTTDIRPDIYRWRDADGRLHFSDTPPAGTNAALYDNPLPPTPEYFTLNIDYQGLQRVPYLSSRLRPRLNKVYAVLSAMIGEKQLRKVALNLKIHPDRERYLASASGVLSDPARTAGFYTAARNQAVTYIHDDHERTLGVAVHEGLHVISAGLLGAGTVPVWLNEGLAEYFENIETRAQYAIVGIKPASLDRARSLMRQGYPRRIMNLLEMDRNSWYQQQEAHYALSWALVFFLFDSEEGREALSTLLTTKAGQYCETLNMRHWLATGYPAGETGLERDFREWLRHAHNSMRHRY